MRGRRCAGLRPLVEIDALDGVAAVDQPPDAGAFDVQHLRRGLGDLLERRCGCRPAPAPASASRSASALRRALISPSMSRDARLPRRAARCALTRALDRRGVSRRRALLPPGARRRLTDPPFRHAARNKLSRRGRAAARGPPRAVSICRTPASAFGNTETCRTMAPGSDEDRHPRRQRPGRRAARARASAPPGTRSSSSAAPAAAVARRALGRPHARRRGRASSTAPTWSSTSPGAA